VERGTEEDTERAVVWVFSNVLLACLPVLMVRVVVFFSSEFQTRKVTWTDILKDGELFFVSSTLAATSLTSLVVLIMGQNHAGSSPISGRLPKAPVAGPSAVDGVVTFLGLLLVLLFSIVLFALTSRAKLIEQYFSKGKTGGNVILNKRFARGSVYCVLIAIVLSAHVFALGGGA